MTNVLFHRRYPQGPCGNRVDFPAVATLFDFQWVLRLIVHSLCC